MKTLNEYTQAGFLKRAAELGYDPRQVASTIKTAGIYEDMMTTLQAAGHAAKPAVNAVGGAAKGVYNDMKTTGSAANREVGDAVGNVGSRSVDAAKHLASKATNDLYIPYAERVQQELSHNQGRQSDLHTGIDFANAQNPALRTPALQGISDGGSFGEIPKYTQIVNASKDATPDSSRISDSDISKFVGSRFGNKSTGNTTDYFSNLLKSTGRQISTPSADNPIARSDEFAGPFNERSSDLVGPGNSDNSRISNKNISDFVGSHFGNKPSEDPKTLFQKAYNPSIEHPHTAFTGKENPFSLTDLIKQHPTLAATGGGGALGALLGSQFGEEEDKGRNSLIGGTLGAGAGYGLQQLAESGQLSKLLAGLKA